MSNILQFRRTDIVVIYEGTITKSSNASEVGRHLYFVDVVEADGCSIGMWGGASYQQAVTAANELAADWGGVPVRNQTDAVPR
jgi:hypothetical protein